MCCDAKLVGVSNLLDEGSKAGAWRLTLTGSMQFDGQTREIRVAWERQGD
jgi:hypothetical protein